MVDVVLLFLRATGIVVVWEAEEGVTKEGEEGDEETRERHSYVSSISYAG